MKRVLVDYDGEAILYSDFLDSQQADHYFSLLLNNLSWQVEHIKFYGKEVKVPRLVAWYGDEAAEYRYSGVSHKPLEWTRELLELRERISSYTGFTFNSVLANLYRDEKDSMGWHSDKEKELGPTPIIASLSLGAERTFKLQHNKAKEVIEVVLNPGCLLIMKGTLQRHWRHCVPKAKEAKSARINLTFRTIFGDSIKST